MHKLALLFVHFCCLLSRISIPSVKRRCNLSHLNFFHKYIQIMKGLYIVRTLSLFYKFQVFYFYTLLFFSPQQYRRIFIAPHLPITIVVTRKPTLPITVPFIFLLYVVNPKLKVLQNAAYFQSLSNTTEKKKYLST